MNQRVQELFNEMLKDSTLERINEYSDDSYYNDRYNDRYDDRYNDRYSDYSDGRYSDI